MIEIASKRYSQSLFEAATDQDKLDLTFEELAGLKRVIEDNQAFFKVLEYPFITFNEKIKTVNEVFSKSFDTIICDFLKVLIEKDRVNMLNEIIRDFEELYYDYKRLLKVQVKTAFELDEDYKVRLIDKLKEVFKQEVVIEVSTDPSIVGGLYIRAKDKVIDATIKGKLDKMKDNLLHDKN
ncbi:MAG TPA: ATP synthase F1 subunit delta [Patescibacteria group bacterium]|nr:ATP synthase F1 subunit delta [Patescibacteria group bacterium]